MTYIKQGQIHAFLTDVCWVNNCNAFDFLLSLLGFELIDWPLQKIIMKIYEQNSDSILLLLLSDHVERCSARVIRRFMIKTKQKNTTAPPEIQQIRETVRRSANSLFDTTSFINGHANLTTSCGHVNGHANVTASRGHISAE